MLSYTFWSQNSTWKARLRRGRHEDFAALDLAIAETCYNHFQSTANQLEFYMLREKTGDKASLARMRATAEQEIELARRQFPIARDHSVIAYEASNHYYYAPLDLVEKVLNCRQVIRKLDRRLEG